MRLRHQRFVDEYLIDLDATQAAIRAGYAPRRATRQSWRLVRRPDIAAAIETAMAARAARTGITVDRVLREYARLAFADPRLVADWGPEGSVLRDSDRISGAAAATIAELAACAGEGGDEVTVRWRLFDKAGALGSIARLLGLFDAPAGAASAGT